MKLRYWRKMFAVLWQTEAADYIRRQYADSTRQQHFLPTSPVCLPYRIWLFLCPAAVRIPVLLTTATTSATSQRDPLSVFSTFNTSCSFSFVTVSICLCPQFFVHYYTLMASSHDVTSCAAPPQFDTVNSQVAQMFITEATFRPFCN
jgi:hypothetical protein